MHYYIDGYNLLFYCNYSVLSLEKQRNKLISILQKIFNSFATATIVFDGNRTEELLQSNSYHVGKLHIIYTEHGHTADEYIYEQLLHKSNLSQVTVVTSDKALSTLCRKEGAHTKSISSFLKWAIKQQKKKIPKDKITYIETEENIARLTKIFEELLNENND